MSAARGLAVTFVLPSFVPTGGAQVVFRHAAALGARGHRVTLLGVAPEPALPWGREGRTRLRHWLYYYLRARVGESLRRHGVAALARVVPRVDPATVPAGDVVVATSFETAEWIAALPRSAGVPLYFLQDYEAWTPDLEARRDATWRLPFVRVAVSRWLVGLGRERFGVEVRGPVGNGVDCERFRPGPRPLGGAVPTVGAVYDARPGKGLDDLLAALATLSRERPETRFLLFGRHRPRHRLPARARYVRSPGWGQLPRLYRTMDVFLHASTREGWGLPPQEAMASGCAVVTTPAGGVPEFADATCARLVPGGDAAALARAALELLDRREEREALGRAARSRAQRLAWRDVHDRMEGELARAVAAGIPS